MQKWWKQPKFLGVIAYLVLSVLKLTLRVKFVKHDEIDADTNYLFAFWHGMQLMPALFAIPDHNTPKCAMVSPSRDGSILTAFLEKIGYQVIRGSSRDGGARALLLMKRKLEQGASLGFGIDGPIGPIHVIKPGIAFLAQKCKIKIVPVGIAFSSYWTFEKAWDKFQVPKPFSKAVMLYGAPYEVLPNADVETACRELEQLMLQAQEAAQLLVS